MGPEITVLMGPDSVDTTNGPSVMRPLGATTSRTSRHGPGALTRCNRAKAPMSRPSQAVGSLATNAATMTTRHWRLTAMMTVGARVSDGRKVSRFAGLASSGRCNT
jgi:hypothetical protein